MRVITTAQGWRVTALRKRTDIDAYDQNLERFNDWAQWLQIPDGKAWELADTVFAHFGIERHTCADEGIEFLNQGDCYAATITLDDSGVMRVECIADFVERVEAEEAEENRYRCGHCGEFRERWPDLCEACDECSE